MAKRKENPSIDDDDDETTVTTADSTLIERLNALDQDAFKYHFSCLEGYHQFGGNRWDMTMYFAENLPPRTLDYCFNLIQTTSKHDYEPSSFGWHPQRKRREMKEKEMRYVLVENSEDKKWGGFISFMFTHDSTPAVPVLYIYEIHLTEAARGQGLGGFLMELVEGFAEDVGVEKVMLTCFLSNKNALSFYRKLGYEVDVCSPGDRTTRKKVVKADYVIMSKDVGNEASHAGEDEVEEEQEQSDDESEEEWVEEESSTEADKTLRLGRPENTGSEPQNHRKEDLDAKQEHLESLEQDLEQREQAIEAREAALMRHMMKQQSVDQPQPRLFTSAFGGLGHLMKIFRGQDPVTH